MFDEKSLNNLSATQAQSPAKPKAYENSGADFCAGTAGREPLIFTLRRKEYNTDIELQRNRRAIEILEKHPEFEELIELMRLLPIY